MTTLESEPEPAALAINDIGTIRLKAAKPLIFDGYAHEPPDWRVYFDRARHKRDGGGRHVIRTD